MCIRDSASTEIVTFHDGTPVDFTSFPIGSLSLYRRCVKKILPGTGSLARLRRTISETIDLDFVNTAPQPLICLLYTSHTRHGRQPLGKPGKHSPDADSRHCLGAKK